MANARAVLGPAASEKMTTLAWVLASSGVDGASFGNACLRCGWREG